MGKFPDISTIDELFEELNPETNDNQAEVTARRPWDLDEIKLLLKKVKIFGTNMPISLNLKYREIVKNCNEFEIT